MENTDPNRSTFSNITEDKLNRSQVFNVDESVEIVFKSPTEKDHEDLRDQLADSRAQLRESQAKQALLLTSNAGKDTSIGLLKQIVEGKNREIKAKEVQINLLVDKIKLFEKVQVYESNSFAMLRTTQLQYQTCNAELEKVKLCLNEKETLINKLEKFKQYDVSKETPVNGELTKEKDESNSKLLAIEEQLRNVKDGLDGSTF